MYYFTFGQSHCHPETGERLKDYWVEIDTDDFVKAREKMFKEFDRKWSMQYDEKEFMRIRKLFPKLCYARFDIDD